MPLPDWQLPPGVPRGVWDYTQSGTVADDYDDYHAFNTLFEFEEQILREEFYYRGQPQAEAGGLKRGTIADLGCGTARALLPFVREGWQGLAIDLSAPMLAVVKEKAQLENLPIECVQANLVELTADLVADESVDHAMCLFSTLGMIRGRANRLQALQHMRRILRPGGRLVLHVHNFWFNLRDPGGPWWVLKSLLRKSEGHEAGDKVFPYRGVPNFFLHVFRASELRRELQEAGFKNLFSNPLRSFQRSRKVGLPNSFETCSKIRRWVPLDVRRRHALKYPWLFPSLRTNGWIIVCER